MSRRQTIKTVLTTFSIAFGVGVFVQYGEETYEEPIIVVPAVPTAVPRAVTVVTNSKAHSVFGLTDVRHLPKNHVAEVRTVASVSDTYVEIASPEMGRIMEASFSVNPCKVNMSAESDIAAMMTAQVDAPCFKNADFDIIHESLRFSGRTDDSGRATITVPAVLPNAKLSVLFDNMERAQAHILVPDASQYDRTIIQWRDAENVQLHALEAGASFGGLGHIWSGSVHSPELSVLGRHGFVEHLGTRETSISYQGEVYTYPARWARANVPIEIAVGAMITKDNCDHALRLQVIRVVDGEVLAPVVIVLDTPSCNSDIGFRMLRYALDSYVEELR